MDENLKEPLNRLAEALHRAIEESSDVDAALQSLRDAGLRAYLLLEVTVALGAAEDDASPDGRQMGFKDIAGAGEATGWLIEIDGTTDPSPHGDLADRVAPADREYLKSLRIRLD